MKLHPSRTLGIIAAQAAVNLLLVSWLANEYVHNRFLQEYLGGFWATNTLLIAAGLVAVGAIVGGYFLAFYRKQGTGDITTSSQPGHGELPVGLASLDICPFCNVALTSLSENRFQCRKCRRYFKK